MKRVTPFFFLFLLLFFFTGCKEKVKERAKPNIIFIMADDLGYGELGCYGQKIIRTPNIDRMAEEGIKFTQFYSGSPVCAPSRSVLMTGMHTGHTYVRDNYEVKGGDGFLGQMPLPDSIVTVAELLKKAGYATAAIGKWGLGRMGSSGDPNRQGFDLFFGYNCQRHAHNHYPRFLIRNQDTVRLEGNTRSLTGKQYAQDLFIREAESFIRQNHDKPFFLYLPFIIPHLSIQVPDSSLEKYKGQIPETPYEHHHYLQHPYPHAGYAAMITHMDEGIGQLLHLVDSLGLDHNTVIFFTSDNGPTYNRLGGSDSDFFHSSGPFRGRKGSVYEGGIRVPLVVRWPGKIIARMVSDHIGAFQDVMPTLLEITGNKNRVPPDIDGISFTPTLLGKGEQQEHPYLYMEFSSYGGQQMVRMDNWKGIRRNIFKDSLQIHLYNLAEDPGETRDVASDHPDIVKKMKKIMLKEHITSSAFPFLQLDSLARLK
ncbi:MAG: arylsulfatase [Chlorobi bacterium]|nr:arylsulfatase [Chlorobiota bacterium]